MYLFIYGRDIFIQLDYSSPAMYFHMSLINFVSIKNLKSSCLCIPIVINRIYPPINKTVTDIHTLRFKITPILLDYRDSEVGLYNCKKKPKTRLKDIEKSIENYVILSNVSMP